MPNQLLPLQEIIKRALDQGIDLGSGDPQNRLRYYTKNSLIPQAKRRALVGGSSKSTVAHYPESIIKRLHVIQSLRDKGFSVKKIKQTLDDELLLVESKFDVLLEHKQELTEVVWGTAILESFFEVSIRNAFPIILALGIFIPSLLSPGTLKLILASPLLVFFRALVEPHPMLSYIFLTSGN